MSRFLIPGFALAIALAGPALAASRFYVAPTASTPQTAAGIISADGQIRRGTGFTVQHPRAGHYSIRFQQGFFPTGCASIVVDSWAHPPYKSVVSEAFVSGCATNNPVFHVRLRRSEDGTAMDRDFQFVAVGV